MNKTSLTFEISKEDADKFLLAVGNSGLKPNAVFEDFVKNYVSETLQRLNAGIYESEEDKTYSDEKKVVTLNLDVSENRAVKKIPLWARKPNQINSQIIRMFFLCEKKGIASRSKMRKLFLQENPEKTYLQFENNLNSMGTDKGNSHGHVFDFRGDEVYISKVVQSILLEYKKFFFSTKDQNGVKDNFLNEKFNMNNLLSAFEIFCKTPGIESGKAQSYANAIQYLCDFLEIKQIDEQSVEKFKNLELHIYRANDEIRNNLLIFLERRNQKSYLTGGFIKAALNYFYPFWRNYNIK